ncbi:MAG: carbohydrate ABC transporter permease, partial [Clostridia bacterium]|nr:carbohydrate ABC transporter permease [Clostridia bacterium]
SLGFYNTMWAIVLPSAVSTMNMIIMRTFFQGIPDALEEAAVVDGASELTTLIRIILPLSLPSMMTIGLFYAVGLWNSWFSAVIYLADTDKYPIQLVLRQIVLQNQVNEIIGTVAGSATEDTTQMIAENVKYTVIIVAVVPILCVYPFIQKYFVKGVMIGSIKG